MRRRPPLAHAGRRSLCSLAALLLHLICICAKGHVIRFPTEQSNWPLNHLVVHPYTGTVYVGAVNRIYQLSSRLELARSHETGPVRDNPACYPPPMVEACPQGLVSTINVNKLLMLDHTTDRLLACGSVFQGVCQLLKPDDLFKLGEPMHRAEHYLSSVNESGTMVAFVVPSDIGEERGVNRDGQHVLYVGTPVGGRVDYFPTLSARKLTEDAEDSEMFDFIYHNEFVSSQLKIPSDTLASFPNFDIFYIYGFHSGAFAYFLTLQPHTRPAVWGGGDASSRGAHFSSKIVRLCLTDSKFYSYVELPVMCQKDGIEYTMMEAAVLARPDPLMAKRLGISERDDVLFAVMARDRENRHMVPRSSVLCMFALSDIDRSITERIRSCYRGEGRLQLSWNLNKDMRCLSSLVIIDDKFCGWDTNQPLGGSVEVKGTALLSDLSDGMTSVVTYIYNNHSVIFVGTSRGSIKKIRVDTSVGHGICAVQYGEIRGVSDGPFLRDIAFSPDKHFLYLLTEQQVVRIPVERCRQFDSCSTCIGAGDPHCGWCVLHARCCRRDECPLAGEPGRFSDAPGRCVKLQASPTALSVSSSQQQLRLKLQNAPDVSPGVTCSFGGLWGSAGSVSGSSVICLSPSHDQIKKIPVSNVRQRVVSLTLTSRETGKNFATVNITFYNCSTHHSCLECVRSTALCSWCKFQHECSDSPGACNFPEGRVNVSEDCPQLLPSSEMVLPAGERRHITLAARNLPQPQSGQLPYQCILELPGGAKPVPALRFNGSSIQCQDAVYDYVGDAGNVTIPFSIVWNGHFTIDNPAAIKVRLYKCTVWGESCGACLRADRRFECGWCSAVGEAGRCTLASRCVTPPGTWLRARAPDTRCPYPRITQVFPLSGPPQGGTLVTIRGQNLGLSFPEIEGRIMVAGVLCHAVPEEFVPAEKIVCETEAVFGAVAGSGAVELCVGECSPRYMAASQEFFSIVQPVVSVLKPAQGPMSGGTRVTFIGNHLDAGSSATVKLGDVPCQVKRRSVSQLLCVSGASAAPRNTSATLLLDRAQLAPATHFRYQQDPRVIRVEPLWSIFRGGTPLTITGFNLRLIQEPRVRVQHNGKESFNTCFVLNDTTMVCKAPHLSAQSIDRQPPASGLRADEFGFELDGVLTARTLNNSRFVYFPDPALDTPADGTLKIKPGTPIILRGENLSPPISSKDRKLNYSVHLAGVACSVSVSESQLLCECPSSLSGTHTLTVAVDRTELAVLPVQMSPDSLLSLPATVGMAMGGGVLLFVVVAMLVAYKRKSHESHMNLERLQTQMDNLEARVALECKEAFAELQTDIAVLTSDVDGAGIPFLDYRTYALRVLFPGIEEHPVLKQLEVPGHGQAATEKALRLFGQLLHCQLFLLTFVRTLEAQRSFGMRDRGNLASLVMSALQGRLEYATDVLKELLADLIARNLESKSHPKLLLRRTESVAEKMLTNWFTFLLFRFLKQRAGEPLFKLYCAMKQQMEKGPIDAVTGEARYSLSEDKLIRQQVDYQTLTLHLVNPENEKGMEVIVKVLDCDSITQVKERLLDAAYKNTPFSMRPRSSELDLEWHPGRMARVVLQDEDLTTKIENNWKRLNTLAHYQVTDGSVIALVPKQLPSCHLAHVTLSRSLPSRYDGLARCPGSHESLRSRTPMLTPELESGARLWHLVKNPEHGDHKEGDRGRKMVSEIYLTRLLTTKMFQQVTLQKFVDDLFVTIFGATSTLPLAIKYMFDFLDAQADRHNIHDPGVRHTWKSNCLPLRFWVNVIKNPQFVFDIHKNSITDACLSVVAQTFMDACSTSEHRLGKDSPSNKLLYAKDIPGYRRWVERYYADVAKLPAVSDQDMSAYLAEQSHLHAGAFNTPSALHEIYNYASKYRSELLLALEKDEHARRQRLAAKLQQVIACMSWES
uniref:plexin-A1-like isoform X1 n=1 Tax=Myxine glutinosa TaxID=7769 RepID=UPI00358EBDEE